MRAYYSMIVRILYFVLPVGGAVCGMVAHKSYGMGLAICGLIGGVLGLITATLLILVTAVIVSIICTAKPFDPKKSQNRYVDDA
jgi:hypothetical protein